MTKEQVLNEKLFTAFTQTAAQNFNLQAEVEILKARAAELEAEIEQMKPKKEEKKSAAG